MAGESSVQVERSRWWAAASTAAARPYVLLLVVAAIGAFHLATLRPGHVWGDDFALYVAHARNLAEGRPYAETGYVHDPFRLGYSPQVYPPGFPALLAAPVALWGPDLERLKPVMPVLFAGFLLAYALWLRRELPPPLVLAAVAFVGVAPGLQKFRESLLSDVPFAGSLFLALWLLERARNQAPPDRDRSVARWTAEALAGVAVYACYAMRVVGAALLPAMVLRELVVHRRVRASTLRISALALALALVQEASIGTIAAYLADRGGAPAERSGSLVAVIAENFVRVPWLVGFFFRAELPAVVGGVLATGLLALAALGCARRLRRGPGTAEAFAVVYTAGMCAFPFLGPRYLLPLFPLAVAWILEAVRDPPPYVVRGRGRALKALRVGAVLGLAASLTGYAGVRFGPPREGIHRAEARELFAFAERELPETSVCVFRKPRALALLGGVHAGVYPSPAAADSMAGWFREIGADCFVRWKGVDEPHYLAFLDRLEAEAGLQRVFSNSAFTLYRPPPAPWGSKAGPVSM